jgi:type VI secretion system protein ImpL
MKAFWRFLTSRWTLSFVGAALICALVWFLGPLVGFLDSWIVRGVVIAAIVLVWLVTNLLLDRKRKNADKALAEGVAAITPADTARAEEVAGMRDKLTTALSLLRKASGTRGYLYEQPWYVIIGPPGAGKTTALLNAGLTFPLAAEMGQGAVAGVGGTRMCDWWFTEQAVLIDTAGRYTTQDSDAAVDRAGWEGFLDLLKRTRPRQPLNGVLVAIGASDIALATPAERLDHARAIRRRIRELTEKLGLRLPIYALFTKADLLAGFSEYFDDLDRTGRDQVWGHSFALADGGAAGPVAGWGEALRGLIARLNLGLVDRLQAERSPDRRALLAGFPAQLASLDVALNEFLTEAFGGSRLDPAPLLRGVYFASGTQAGTPIDRLTGALARNFGVDQMRVPSLRPQQGRSYFLGGLLKLIFNEAMLASAKPGAGRRRTLLRLAGFAGIGLLTLGLAAAMLGIRSSEMNDAARVQAALNQYEQLANGQKLDPVSDSDLSTVLPLLNAARALPYGEASPGGGFGLSQSKKYAEGTKLLYHHTLERILLPRLIWRLENQMRENLEKPDFLYEATRVYLMLGSQGPMDHDLVEEWEKLDFSTLYPDPAMQADLQKHLQTLLAGALPEISLDWTLVGQARITFSRVTLAQRVYSRLRPSAAAQAVPDWTPAAALGASGTQVFYRASGKPLTEGIPGFYTVEGFHGVLLANLAETARQVAGESWVLGEKSSVNPLGSGLAALQNDVVNLYTQDYAAKWDAMLQDLDVQPLGGGEAGIRTLYILGSPQSPMRDLLTSIAHELTLSKVPPPTAEEAAAAKLEGKADARLAGLLGGTTPVVPPGKVIDDRYKALRDYVGIGPGAPLDLAIKLLGDLQQQLAASASAGAGGAAPAVAAGGNVIPMLQAEGSRAPQPVQRWLTIIGKGTSAARAGAGKAAAKAAFAAPDGPASLCEAAVNGRYPFTRGAAAEIPLDDFTKLFAPGGKLDAYFKAQIAPFVDMSGRTWRLQSVGDVPPPISSTDLAQFQRAASIRDLFFGSGSLAVHFEIAPEFLDTAAKQATLDLSGSTVMYAHGPIRGTQVNWPGQGMSDIRLSFDPPPPGGGVIETQGPWALFRFFDQGAMSPGISPEQFSLAFTSGAHQMRYHIRAGSVLNPFGAGILQGFRCPTLK